MDIQSPTTDKKMVLSKKKSQKKTQLHLQLEQTNRHAEFKQHTHRQRMNAGVEASTGHIPWVVGSATERGFQSPWAQVWPSLSVPGVGQGSLRVLG